MTLEVDYGQQPREFAEAVRALCRRHEEGWRHLPGDGFPEQTWQDLADIGFLGLAAEGTEVAGEIAAVMEELGGLGCPGPLWETVLATRAAAEPPADGIATVGTGGPLPWGHRATVFFALTDDGLWECEPVGEAVPTPMLTGELWAEVPLAPRRRVPDECGALALGDLALAAQLVGAGARLVRDAAEYVAGRHQFRRPLGDFQGVAFPLAEADIGLAAARALTSRAASRLADGSADAAWAARAAVLSAARAARTATYHTFQAYGAMAFTEEGGVAWYGRRVAQLRTQALTPYRRAAWTADVFERNSP
ncbi:acyl-CoA dehydrogenase family protein [Micromonospora sp. NPDC020750]|uniref:acyl-CoA dehydrogenase family protein n=1 Tax=unclassified Micromonospora TaxID=2617518 RepID=UPI0037BC61BB